MSQLEQLHDEDELKSKTEIKREMLALQELGRKIVKLPPVQRQKLPLDEDMQDALVLADKIKNKHEAFKRHMQYIGKLLREVDLEEIQKAMDAIANKHQQETNKFHQLEQLRDELIVGDNELIEKVLADCPTMERQKLRQLVRQAKKEMSEQKPKKYYRELFQYIKENQE